MADEVCATYCEERKQVQANLRAAFERWYEVKDIPGKERVAREAQLKMHHVQRSLGDHVAKHGRNCE